MELDRISIGVPGALGPEAVAGIAAAVETAGFAGLWVNDTPDGDAIAALAAAAAVTRRLRLGTGVVPLDRRPAEAIASAVQEADLPADRTLLGIGVGAGGTGSLARVREAVTLLRERTGAAIVVGALGPRTRRVAAEEADGVLLNWLTPVTAAAQRDHARTAARHIGRPAPGVVLYVRTIVDDSARAALEEESARYGSYDAYAANFARLGITPSETTLAPAGAHGLASGVAAYLAAVDELVLRAIPSDPTPAGYLDFVERARIAVAERDAVRDRPV